MDPVGKIDPPRIGGANYFLLLRDEYSSNIFVDFMSTKNHVTAKLKKFITEVSTKTESRIKYFRSDNGSEFVNQGVKLLCDSEGIIEEFSAPYTPEQNGEAEGQ